VRATRVVPANRLSPFEGTRVVTTLDSARFVDQPPLQVYAQLLDEDIFERGQQLSKKSRGLSTSPVITPYSGHDLPPAPFTGHRTTRQH
jgi:hypothetical protein